MQRVTFIFCLIWAGLLSPRLQARTWIVAPSGGDFSSIQAALDVAVAGDLILVQDGGVPYFEKLVFPRSGDATAGFIRLQAWPGDRPILDGTGVPGAHMVFLENRSYVQIQGFEIRNLLQASDGSGIRVTGSGNHIEILDNRIHDIRGTDAMGITVYGTASTSIADLVIRGNEIYDCEPARSEALVLNGNIERFEVCENVVRDVNNIGIDFIGGEADIHPTQGVRNGICVANQVFRANSNYGGGYAAGIYVDGGRDILIQGNLVSGCDLGIEVGCENQGWVAANIEVRDNLIVQNQKSGLVFGGYAASVGRVQDCNFVNNVLFQNNELRQWASEIEIQYSSNNVLRHNIVVCNEQNQMVYGENTSSGNLLDWNLWFAAAGNAAADFTWQGQYYPGFTVFQSLSGQAVHGRFQDPQFVAPNQGDFHLQAGSPAIDGGDPGSVLTGLDFYGFPRLQDGLSQGSLVLDQGAHEYGQTALAVSGAILPGATLDLQVQGPAGWQAWLVAGVALGEEILVPYGLLMIDRQAPWLSQYLGTAPGTFPVTVPVTAQTGTWFHLQVVAVAPGGQLGQFSNPVSVQVE